MILYEDDIERLEKIQEFINSNLDKDLRVDTFCKMFSISSAKIQRHFSFYFNQPIHQFVHEQRMVRAKYLLVNRLNCVTDVAELVGYKDRCSFSRAYTKYFNQNPFDNLKDH